MSESFSSFFISAAVMMALWIIMASVMIAFVFLVGEFFGVWEFVKGFLMEVAN